LTHYGDDQGGVTNDDYIFIWKYVMLN
jgi:hypothetical protein